jgi:hypothetical protein
VEHIAYSRGKTGVSVQRGANCGAFMEFDPDLQAAVDAWPSLPASLRSAILGIIKCV